MEYLDLFVVVTLSNLIFSEVEMFDALAGESRRSVNAGFIIIKDRHALDGVVNGQVFSTILYGKEIF